MTRLIDAYIPWFARIQNFLQAPAGSLEEAAERIDTWFREARARAAGASCPAEHAELAAYAAAAWADERLQTGSWEHAGQWHAHLLQRRHFGVVNAGEGFFRHLRKLGPQQQEVREVFALALLLGLRGRFVLDADEQAWRKTRDAEVARLLDATDDDQGLLTGSLAVRGARTPQRRLRAAMRSTSGIAAAAVAALCVLFGLYVVLLHQAIRQWFAT